MDRRQVRFGLLLYLLSLSLRLAFFALTETPLPPDGEDYLKLGSHLVATGELGYDWNCRSYRGPIYPGFIAGLKIAGLESERAIGWAQIVLSSFIPVVCYYLFRRGFAENAARAGAVLCAVWPDLILYSGVILSESPALLLLLLCLLAVLKAFDGPRYGVFWALPGGILAAAAILAKGVSLSLLPALAVLLWTRRGDFARRPRLIASMAALFTLGFGIVEMPWIVRNYGLHQKIIPIVVGNFWHTVHVAYQDRAIYNEQVTPDYLFSPEVPELEQERRLKAETMEWIRSHPGTSVLLVYTRSLRFWNPWPDTLFQELASPWPRWANYLMPALFFALILSAAAFGFVLRQDRSPVEGMLLAHAIGVFALACLTHWEVRYRFSVLPLLAIYAGEAWSNRASLAGKLWPGTGRMPLRYGLALGFLAYSALGVLCIWVFIERGS